MTETYSPSVLKYPLCSHQNDRSIKLDVTLSAALLAVNTRGPLRAVEPLAPVMDAGVVGNALRVGPPNVTKVCGLQLGRNR